MEIIKQDLLQSNLIRILLCAFIVMSYIWFIRPVRAVVNQNLLLPITETTYFLGDTASDIKVSKQAGIEILWMSNEVLNTTSIKIPFGFDFIFGMMGLILLKAKTEDYRLLVAIQVVGYMISILFAFAGLLFSAYFFHVSNLLSVFLVAICSFGVIPLVFIRRNYTSS